MNILCGKKWKLFLSINIIVLFSAGILLLNAHAGAAIPSGMINGVDVSKLTPQEIESLLKIAR